MKTTNISNKSKKLIYSSFLFNNIPETQIEYLIDKLIAKKEINRFSYERGEIITDFNSSNSSLLIIESGKISVTSKKDKHTLLNTLLPGNEFGAASVFANSLKINTLAIATNCSTIISINKTGITELMTTIPLIAENYLSFLSNKIAFLNKKIDSFTATTAEDKLMEYLNQLPSNEKGVVILPLSRLKLAEWLSIGRASLYRAFTSLENSGKININGNVITILKER